MRTLAALLCAFSIALGLSVEASAQGAKLIVAPNGNDAWSGTLPAPNKQKTDGPFATLERARDAIRAMKKAGTLPKGGVTVLVRGGVYERSATFQLEAADSGTAEAPITWCAYPGEEVRLVGGRVVPATAFRPLEGPARERLDPAVRGKVLQADLKALGITDVGNLPVTYRGAAPIAELFFNDRRMEPARWPNEGWTTIAKIIDAGSNPREGDKTKNPGIFEYAGDRPARWSVQDGVWLQGYWCFDWYDEVIQVKEIDLATRRITMAAPHFYSIKFGNRDPRRYRAVHVFAELDQPGEYYIDRKAGTLAFLPPASLKRARIALSLLDTPVVALNDVSHVVLQGFTVEACRGDGISIQGGTDNRVLACLVRNTGKTGIAVEGGTQHCVQACDIHDTGTLGLLLTGGDRKTLTPAEHVAENNHIHHFSRRQLTYASGIQVGGVGNLVMHNLLHDAPHQAIGLSGNDHLIEYNVVHHVCLETDDCGAFYKGRNPSNRGNVIRYNFWHHTGKSRSHGNNTIYFDDGDGGDIVFGNVFFRAGEPSKGTMGSVFSHGGHDIQVENNIFIECKRAIGASPWNDKRWLQSLQGETYQTRLLKEVDITKPPYTTRYPDLVGLLQPDGKPRMSRAVRNVSVMCGEFVRGNYTQEDNFVTAEDPGFVNLAKGDFRLRKDSLVFKQVPGFQPIPFEKMGLYRDALRPTLPVQKWTYPAPKPLPPLRAAAKPAAPKKGAPVFKVARVAIAPTVDGVLQADEWGTQAMPLAQDASGNPVQRRSTAWLLTTDTDLYIALDNPVHPQTQFASQSWGSDAVEIAVRNPGAGAKPPIWVLRGYPGGRFEVGTAAHGDEEPKTAPAPGVAYQARVLGKDRWVAEWRIPLSLLGLEKAKAVKLPFSLTVRKAHENLWVMWEGTRGHSYDVTEAGFIEW